MEVTKDKEEKTISVNKVLRVENINRCIGCYACMLACSTRVHQNFSLDKSALRLRTSGGYQGRMVVDICRGCSPAACVEKCGYQALCQREGGGVVYKEENCTGCKACIDGCLIGAIHFDDNKNKAIVCIQCGICATRCPHRVLRMEEGR